MSAFYPFGARAPLRLTFWFAMALLIVFTVIPAAAVFVIAFTDIQGLPGIPIHWVGFDNFVRFFSAARIGYNLNALQNTLIYAVASTVIINAIALAVAVLLNQKLRGRNFTRAIVFLPTILGVTVIGLIWSLFFNPSRGPAATVWSWFAADSAFFGDPALALPLVIFVQIWAGLGVAVVIYLAGLQAIPEELYEAASIDGATGGQRTRFITIPLLAPSVTANVLLAIVGSLQSYQLAYVLTGPNNPATQLLSLAIFSQAFGGSTASGAAQTQGYAATISVVQFFVVSAVAALVLIYLRRREAKL
ncbi:raffinose/stachyose/melibiose transport system permease protein [Microbacterium proteolyticum]|uniref:Raffinose/stachyose/melibiose transport system permease protein n=1 Tax=Microbacterium proteolyticum TaxID=1572644 RepID=A0A7W5CII6_9MICO|nr:sugar ABC transporter permease [Microbacterium proteolyticum]MBB3158338.1 raffinose/stachyose/melibiose transport system permease protein [Microbacterium proteolyticum]